MSEPSVVSCPGSLLERGADVTQQPVQPGELSLVDADRITQQRQPHGPLVDQPRQRLEDRVEAAQLAQRHEGAPVRRVLPGAGTDPGEPDSGADRLVHGSDCAGGVVAAGSE